MFVPCAILVEEVSCLSTKEDSLMAMLFFLLLFVVVVGYGIHSFKPIFEEAALESENKKLLNERLKAQKKNSQI